MGTRSTYRIIEKGVYEGKLWQKKFILVYMQFDGYPNGHPLDTAKWLAGGKMINGIGMQDTGLVFNGASCLAAQFVAKYKTGVGSTYIEPMDHRGRCGEDYMYDIVVEDKKITMVAYENHSRWREKSRVKTKKLFEGTPQEYVEKYSEVEVEE
jgi:hypothetical protein